MNVSVCLQVSQGVSAGMPSTRVAGFVCEHLATLSEGRQSSFAHVCDAWIAGNESADETLKLFRLDTTGRGGSLSNGMSSFV